MKRHSLILLFALLGLMIICSCKKNKTEKNQEPPVEQDSKDEASEDAQTLFSNLPSVEVDLRDVILPNGENVIDFALQNDKEFMRQHLQYLPEKYRYLFATSGPSQSKSPTSVTSEKSSNTEGLGPQAIKNITILRYQVLGNYLITDALHKTTINDGKKPEQLNGIAYALGSKQFSTRAKGTGCTEEVFGIDCSGMVAYIVNGAGIPIPTGNAFNQSDTTTWKDALKLAGADFEKIKVKKFKSTEITSDSIQTGDVVSFYEGSSITHIGIALRGKDGKVRLFQSNGSQKSCKANYDSPNKGPREIDLLNPLSWKNDKGVEIFTDYSVLRLVVDISGDWTAFLRCEGEATNAIEMSLKIPANDGGNFKAEGAGMDYNGEPIKVILYGSYNKKENKLSGLFTFSFADSEDVRTDKFITKLDMDETPFFPLTKVEDNGGCDAQLKLNNKVSKSPVVSSRKSGTKVMNGLRNPRLTKR